MEKPLRVVSLSRDRKSRAGRAVARIEKSIAENSGANVQIFPLGKEDIAPTRELWNRALRAAWKIGLALEARSFGPYSLAQYQSGLGTKIASLQPDLVHLHWIGDGTLSIREIAAIDVPIIWTLHDQWPFNGIRHISPTPEQSHQRSPLLNVLDRITLNRKLRLWSRKVFAVSPSQHQLESLSRSQFFSRWTAHHIPNPVEFEFWRPIPNTQIRDQLGLKPDDLLLLFVSGSALRDRNKGFHWFQTLISDLNRHSQNRPRRQVVGLIIGKRPKLEPQYPRISRNLVFAGYQDDQFLRDAYSAADALILTSKSENLPSVALESIACGTPVVGFECGGLEELIRDDRVFGSAVPFGDLTSLMGEIERVTARPATTRIGDSARKRLERKFSMSHVSNEYRRLYRTAAEER